MVAVTARIVTNDKSFDASKHTVNFVVTTPDGVKRSFTSVTDGNGVAFLDVRFPPGPAVVGLPIGFAAAALPLEAGQPVDVPRPVCILMGGVTSIGLSATVVFAPVTGPAAPATACLAIMGAGVGGIIMANTCESVANMIGALAKPRPMAADGGSSGGAAGGKDDALQGQAASPDPGKLPQDDRDKKKSGDEKKKPESEKAGRQGDSQRYNKVTLNDAKGNPLAEMDITDVENKKFVEEKSAEGIDKINPRTGNPQQSPDEWAKDQIFDHSENWITKLESADRVGYNGITQDEPPRLKDLREIKNLEFRIRSQNPRIMGAVEEQLGLLRTRFPDWRFSVVFGE